MTDPTLLMGKLRQQLAALSANPDLLPGTRQYLRARYVPAGVEPRRSAVLLALYQVGGEWVLPLIVRPEYEGVHSGQVAFPGGKYEEGDGSLEYTALREAHEEVGVEAHFGDLLGNLTEVYIPPSNSLVTPVVAWLPYVPRFVPDAQEVAQVLVVPLAHLRDPAHWGQKHVLMSNGDRMPFKAYLYQGHEIWGATARMISELLELSDGLAGL
jgi:8-oxo-dGTP pyrophosphatase MutT (NUDIX family)